MKPVFPPLLTQALLSAMMLGAGFSALAQTPAPGAAAGEPHSKHRMEGMAHMEGMDHMDPSKREARHSKHLAALKTRLNLTAAQEPAWTAFTSAMKPAARKMERPDHAALDKLSTPERIDKMRELRAKHHAERQAAIDQRDQAVKTFYATLSDAQKKVMDAEHARMGKAMQRMHEGRHARHDKKAPAASSPAPATKP